MPMLPRRRARAGFARKRIAVGLALGATAVLAPAAAATAATPPLSTSFSFSDAPVTSTATTDTGAVFASEDGQGGPQAASYTLTLTRDGQVIASDTEKYPYGQVSLPAGSVLQAGDVATFYVGSATAPVAQSSATYDGLPNISSAPCGASGFSGSRTSGADARGGVIRNSAGSGAGVRSTTTAPSATTYAVTLSGTTLQAGDQPYITDSYSPNANTFVYSGLTLPPLACPATSTTTTTTTTNTTTIKPVLVPPTLAQIAAALQSSLANFAVQVSTFSPLGLAKQTHLVMKLVALQAGTFNVYIYVLPEGALPRAVIAKKAKAKTVLLGTGQVLAKAPGKVAMTVPLKGAGKAALRRGSAKSRVSIIVTFKPAGSKAVERAQSTVTLKGKAKAKKTVKKKKK